MIPGRSTAILCFCLVTYFTAYTALVFSDEGENAATISSQSSGVSLFDYEYDLSNLDEDGQTDSSSENTHVKVLGNETVDFGGFIKQDIGYSFQSEDFEVSKIRSTLNLGVTYSPSKTWKLKLNVEGYYDVAYELEGRDKFSEGTLDVYESDARVNEFFIDGDLLPWLNVRIGRQYFSWGETLGGQVSDIGNPRDLRELGLQNIEDARLPVGASKITFYGASWEYNLIGIHEIRADEIGGRGSDYDPFIDYVNNNSVILEIDEPSSSLANTEILNRLFLSRRWGDISFFWGKVYEDIPVLELVAVVGNNKIFEAEFNEIESFGAFGNIISGAWIYKFDVARLLDSSLSVSRQSIEGQIAALSNPELDASTETINSWKKKDKTQFMLGVEYAGMESTTLSLEYTGQKIDDYDERYVYTEEEFSKELSLFVSMNSFRERLLTSLWWSHNLDNDTELYRFDFVYRYTDDLKLGFSVNGVRASDAEAFFYNYRNTDRITLTAKLNF